MEMLQQLASEYNLMLINDAAQAHGTIYHGKNVGSLDDLNCYSFYPTKNMTTGEGGMVTTNSLELYEKGKLLRSHGQSSKYYHTILGLNYRMTDIAAVIGIKQLGKLDENIDERRRNAEFLSKELGKIDGIHVPVNKDNIKHSFHQYSVLLDLNKFKHTRDEFIMALGAENIGCAVHYPIPLTKQPAFKDIAVSCPVSEDISQRIFSLPVHPRLKKKSLIKVVVGVKKVASHYAR
jgi:dTDP-4-amino-4,6-dideoxygalactose transaminase